MSIKDYNKRFIVLNVTSNESTELRLDNNRQIMATLTKSELDLLDVIMDALNNDCNVAISIGYKRVSKPL